MKTIIFEGRLIVLNYVKEIFITESQNDLPNDFRSFTLTIKYFDNQETIHITKLSCDDFSRYYRFNQDERVVEKFQKDSSYLTDKYRDLYRQRWSVIEEEREGVIEKIKELERNYFLEKGYDLDVSIDQVRANLEKKVLFLQSLLNDLPNPIIIK